YVLPGLAAIIRTIETAAIRDATLAVVLSRADPNRQRIFGIDRNRADGIRTFAIKDRSPRRSIIHRFPNATRGGGNEKVRRVIRLNREANHSARSESRANRAKLQSVESRRRHRVARLAF